MKRLSDLLKTPLRACERLAQRPGRALVAVFVLALVLRLVHLDRGMTADELTTWQAARMPLREMVAERAYQGHLPVYFGMVRPWVAMMPRSAGGLRVLSLLAGLATLWGVWRLGRLVLGERGALGAAGLFALNAAAIWTAQTFRAYAFLGLFLTLGLCFFVQAERTRGWGATLAFCACSVLGLLFQSVYAFYLIGPLLYLMLHYRWRVYGQWRLLLALGVALAAAVPAYLWLAGQVAIQPDRPDRFVFKWWEAGQALAAPLVGDFNLVKLPLLKYAGQLAAAVLVLLLLNAGWRSRGMAELEEDEEEPRRRAGVWCLLLTVVSAAAGIFVLIWYGQEHALSLRYFLPLSGPMMVLAVAGLGVLEAGRARNTGVAVLLLLLVPMCVAQLRYDGEGLKEAFRYLKGKYQYGEALIAVHGDHVRKAINFYGTLEMLEGFHPVDRYEQDQVRLAEQLRSWTKPGERFWVLEFHERDSPVGDLARSNDFAERLKKKKLERVQILELRRLRTAVGPVPAPVRRGASPLTHVESI
jgi:hypothetical protein